MTGSSSFSSSLFRRPCGTEMTAQYKCQRGDLDCGWFPGLTETLVSAHLTLRYPLEKPEMDEKTFSAR